MDTSSRPKFLETAMTAQSRREQEQPMEKLHAQMMQTFTAAVNRLLRKANQSPYAMHRIAHGTPYLWHSLTVKQQEPGIMRTSSLQWNALIIGSGQPWLLPLQTFHSCTVKCGRTLSLEHAQQVRTLTCMPHTLHCSSTSVKCTAHVVTHALPQL